MIFKTTLFFILSLAFSFELIAQVSIKELYKQNALTVKTLSDTLWTKKVDKYPGINSILDRENIYIGLNKSGLACINSKTGNSIWTLDTINCIGKINIDSNFLYVYTKSDILFQIDKLSGKILWKLNIDFDDDIISNILIDNKFIFINSSSNKIYKISKAGKILYSTQIDQKLLSIIDYKEKIVCVDNNGGYSILNKEDGKIKQKIKIFKTKKSKINNIGQIDNRLFISNDVDTIFVVDLKTNRIIKRILEKNLFIENKTIYCYNDTSFSKLNNNFEKEWFINDIDCRWFLQPTVLSNRLILQTRYWILELNDKSGELNYLIEFSAKSYTKPIIMNDNSIIIGYTNTFSKRLLP